MNHLYIARSQSTFMNITQTIIGICLFVIVIVAAIVFSDCDLPKTPRYWLRILFEKKE